MKTNDLFRQVLLLSCLALCACSFTDNIATGAHYPAIARDPVNGRYLAVYLKVKLGNPDAGGAGGGSRLYGVFIDSSDSLQGNEFVIAEDSGFYYCPAIAFDPTHMQYLVIWYVGDYIFGQFVNSEGSLSGTRLTMTNAATAPRGRCSAVTYDNAAQKFMAVWGEQKTSSRDSINAQLLNADGSFAGTKLTVSDDGANSAFPSIAYDAISQRFLVVWNSADNLAIKGRMVNPDGTFVANEFTISSTNGAHHIPTATYNSVDARFLVSWEHTIDDGTYDLVSQQLNADGSAYQSLIEISSPGRNVFHHTSVYNPSDNNYLILFGGNARELLYAQVVKSDGTLDTSTSTDNILVSNAGYPHDTRPAAAFDNINKRYFTIWEYGVNNDREVFPDIHGRLINADGSPAGDISVVSNGGVW